MLLLFSGGAPIGDADVNLAADLTVTGTLDATLTVRAPDVFLSATLTGVLRLDADLTPVVPRRNRPRREYLWMHGLDGDLKGVVV